MERIRGGGVAIIYREDLRVEECKELNTDENEILWAKTKISGKTHLIATVYRPQFHDLVLEQSDIFEQLLQNANYMARDIIIMGDFNIDLLSKSKERRRLEELMMIHGFRQTITTPTRSTENSESLIDHVWVSEECTVLDSGTIEGLSDHAGTYATLNKKVQKPKEVCRPYLQKLLPNQNGGGLSWQHHKILLLTGNSKP